MSISDRELMIMARSVAGESNDPYTSVGCVIVNQNGDIISSKPNRIPTRVVYLDREDKNRFVIHAEMNAILSSGFADLRDCKIVTWMGGGFMGFPCSECAKHIISVGCSHVLVNSGKYHPGLKSSQDTAEFMLRRVGIRVTEVDIER